jgi:hypothetical protein
LRTEKARTEEALRVAKTRVQAQGIAVDAQIGSPRVAAVAFDAL